MLRCLRNDIHKCLFFVEFYNFFFGCFCKLLYICGRVLQLSCGDEIKSMLWAVDPREDTRLWCYCGCHQYSRKSSSAWSSSSASMINFLRSGSYKILQDIYNYHYNNHLGKGTASRICPLKSLLRSCINIYGTDLVCALHKTMNIYIYREPNINQGLV